VRLRADATSAVYFARVRRVVGWWLVLGLATVSVGCSGSDDDGGRPAGATTTGAASTTTSAAPCTLGAGYEPGTTTQRLTVAGVEREFLVHLPPRPPPAMPLVVDFHGANSDMTQQSVYSGFDPLADAEGFVVASPNGVDAAVRQWRFLGTEDDRTFAVALVDELVEHACVDPDRVFAAGISSGAAMSASLACFTSDRFAGFGLVAANFYIPALCGDAEPRPMVIFHGTADEVVPYEGGPIATSSLSVQPAEESAAGWAEHHGCDPEPTEEMVGRTVVRIAWSGCTEPVVLYRVDGGGHTWPGAEIAVERLGPTTDEVDASSVMWDLFRDASLP
jgi:polyhydroxybutyrate depolymerase